MGQNRSDSLTGESKALPDNKKVPVTLLCRAVGANGVMTVDAAFLRTGLPGALIKGTLLYSDYSIERGSWSCNIPT